VKSRAAHDMQTAAQEKTVATSNTSFHADRYRQASPSGDLARDTSVSESLARLDALAKVMDSAVTIPGTNVTMGLDAALGLLPVIGDAISSAIGGYIIWEARRLGASKILIARMAANTTVDTLVGSIPIVGDVFDVAFRSNRKNVALLRRHIEKRGLAGSRDGKTIEASYRVEQ
jgi:hypothetical protein